MNGEEKYIKGFNKGYLLSKHEPALTTKITQNLQSNSEYVEGLIAGTEEYEIEKSLQQFTELQDLRNGTKNREQDLEQEK
jgi:hypothetical protein